MTQTLKDYLQVWKHPVLGMRLSHDKWRNDDEARQSATINGYVDLCLRTYAIHIDPQTHDITLQKL